MNGLEAAIKNALARSDRSSAEVRARIYQSSREALEAGLRKQNIEDPQTVAQHRQRLEHLIRLIEADERERLLGLVAEQEKKARPQVDAAPSADHAPRREPTFGQPSSSSGVDNSAGAEFSAPIAADRIAGDPKREATSEKAVPVSAQTQSTTRSEPRLGTDDDFLLGGADDNSTYDLTNSDHENDDLRFKAEPIVARKKRRGLFARMLIAFTLLGFIILGAAWVYTSGVFISAAERDQSVPNPPAEVQEEDYLGEEEQSSQPALGEPTQQLSGSFTDDWLEIFNVEDNVGTLQAGNMVTTENVVLPSGKALKVASRSGSTAGEISFDVPVEIMRQLTGRSATIAVTLQASTDTPTQIAIECDFRNLGNCSRHRFTAMPERSDMLIDAKFSDAIVANSAGKITLNTDITGEGRSINLYSVRVLPFT